MIEFITGDCLEVMRGYPDRHFSLVFGSPPYEAARTYGIGFSLSGQDWVDWMVSIFKESLRVCNGLVAFVVEGRTRKFRWSATPALLMADLHRAGVCLRKPPAFHRMGIPGSGGPDGLRNDYEFTVCATNGGRLPWSDNTAMGTPPRYAPGGAMSHRTRDGSRVNQWGQPIGNTVGERKRDGTRGTHTRPSHRQAGYGPPVLANPGNVITCKVGGGHMGHRLAHENEAPFPERLAEFFVRSFCPPGGLVLDPFSGSGTTLAVCYKTGRNGIGIDCRASQTELGRRRLADITEKSQCLGVKDSNVSPPENPVSSAESTTGAPDSPSTTSA